MKEVLIFILENPGIDPGASRMLSERSTIWASLPDVSPGVVLKTCRTIKSFFLQKCEPKRGIHIENVAYFGTIHFSKKTKIGK